MNDKISESAKLVANLIVGECPAVKNSMPLDEIENSAEKFLNEWRNYSSFQKLWDETAPEASSENSVAKKKTNQSTRAAVFDSGTRPADGSSDEYMRFLNGCDRLMKSGKALLEIEKNDDKSGEKMDARRNCFAEYDEIRNLIYGL